MHSVESEWKWAVEHEGIRRVLRAELRHHTLTRLGERLGVPPQTLRTIMRAGEPQLTQEQRQALDALCSSHPAREPEPGAVAVAILVAGLPVPVRQRMRVDLVRQLHEAYASIGMPLPGWIEDELLAGQQLAPAGGAAAADA